MTAAARLAAFCVATGVAPSEARQLTLTEMDAFLDAVRTMQKRR